MHRIIGIFSMEEFTAELNAVMPASARGREVRRGDIHSLTFVLGQATPDAVGFMHLEGVLATVLQDRTAQAHGLGCTVAVAARWSSLTVGMEEDIWVLAPAGAVELPFPQICNWPWQAVHEFHG
jgi:hypothetical protein